MKYKPLDKVRIQSLEWYKKEIESEKWCPNTFDIYWCSREMTISKIEKSHYLMEEDGQEFWWTDEMIEGLVEDEMPLNIDNFQDDNEIIDIIDEYVHRLKDNECQINLPEGYQFADENGNVINATKIVLEKKKKEYPKTYEECCEALEYIPHTDDIIGYKWDILQSLQKLLVCRDAYWKIAGEEMGLGKSWEPDWDDESDKFTIGYFYNDIDTDIIRNYESHPFAFPTKEMRDAFYENFKELIEQCKELL